MRACDQCGKGIQVGMNVSHSHIRTKKRSFPNLHTFTVGEGSIRRRMHLCTKCLRIVKKEQKEKFDSQKNQKKIEIASPA
ncbi:MAG: 50S ribosomal protein L28 [Candidatus Woykebacteria bacterium RBG_16_43_9]|uniref:Large ribosomal subunit protein bL28 n=1 Tax=Candidatus Woykebacteria bacterium RBG_16_43_9 TaxID=1802596 RepID=A0A1G1WFN5_9BACT|nr:MAG: 50S ribosomal protein L28 [Candidatus Woykebacteria bacterium RBG_16_43_9]